MRTIVVGGAAALLALSTAGATGALAGGNGAQVSGLAPQTNNSNSCASPSSGTRTNGFAMLNAPGKPGSARLVNGEVSMKGGPASTTYAVEIAQVTQSSNGTQTTCMPEGTLTTNGQGNGNAHLTDATLSGGTYYVVLSGTNGEAFASGVVTLN